MFHNFILPSAVFLYYMNLDLNDLDRLDLYLIDEKTYNIYHENVSGEYLSGTLRKRNGHIILIKCYENNFNRVKSSLFHELMHLVDNRGFHDYDEEHEIDYDFRWHEIKAKYVSKVFTKFYIYINDKSNISFNFRKSFLINKIAKLKGILKDRNYKLNILLDRLYLLVDCRVERNSLLLNHSKEIIQLLKSLKTIVLIKKFLNNIKVILK